MNLLLDTSVVLRVLFGQERPMREWGRWNSAYVSELVGLEARRAIDRLRSLNEYTDAQVAHAHTELRGMETQLRSVPISGGVVSRASMPMGTVVKSLDAIHIATALVVREARAPDLRFATHDARQAEAATAMGLDCVGL